MFLPSVGTIIDNRFAILAHQGDGGMGSVFKARQLGLERVVALKWQHSSLIGDPESFARFEREGRSLAELNHPNIPVFYHFGLWHNCPYIAMEYLEGNTLREILAREKRLPWRLGINIALQVCDAMGSAHARGIIHRDLSPNNLLILNDSDAEVKIVDFGLSLNKNSAAQHLTQTGELIGSIFYMSPEQCLGRKADHRSDIYSLGCVLYEMITGVPPLIADNPIGLMHKHSNEMPIPIATVLENEPVPAGLSQTLFKAMAKDPSTRYQSMSELRDDLLLVIEGRAISTVISLQEPTAKSLGTGPGLCAAVGCLVLLATLLVLNTPKLRDASSVDGVTLAAQPGKMRGSPVGLSGRVSIALATPEPERLSRCSQIISTLNRQNVESLPPNSVLQLFNRVLPDALSKHDYGRACTLAQKQVELLQDTSKRTCLLDAKIVCANTYVEAGRIEPAIKLYKSTLTELSERHAVRGSKRMQGICCQGLATCALCKFAWSDAANYQDRALHLITSSPEDLDQPQYLLWAPRLILLYYRLDLKDKAKNLQEAWWKSIRIHSPPTLTLSLSQTLLRDLESEKFHTEACSLMRECVSLLTKTKAFPQAAEAKLTLAQAVWITDPQEALALFDQCIEAGLHRQNLPKMLTRDAYLGKGNTELILHHNDRASECFDRAVNLVNDNFMQKMFTLTEIARIQAREHSAELSKTVQELKHTAATAELSLPAVGVFDKICWAADELNNFNCQDSSIILIDQGAECMKARSADYLRALCIGRHATYLQARQRLHEAIPFFQQSISLLENTAPLDDRWGSVYWHFASLLTHEKRFSESEAVARSGLAKSVDQPLIESQGWMELGECYEHQKSMREAEQCYQKSTSIRTGQDSADVGRTLRLITFYQSQGELKKAMEECASLQEKITRLSATSAGIDFVCRFMLARASIYRCMRMNQLALKDLYRTVDVSSKYNSNQEFAADLLICDTLNEQHKFAEIKAVISGLRKHTPPWPSSEIDIREAGLLVSTGQIENGLKLADKVVHASPDSALFLTVAADLNHSYNHEKELQYLKAALEIRQKGPENGFPDLNYIKTACAIRLPLPRSARQTSK